MIRGRNPGGKLSTSSHVTAESLAVTGEQPLSANGLRGAFGRNSNAWAGSMGRHVGAVGDRDETPLTRLSTSRGQHTRAYASSRARLVPTD